MKEFQSIEERGGDVACVIVELRGTMNTPIRSFPPPGALPGQYTQARIDGIGYTADELDDEVQQLGLFKEFLFISGKLSQRCKIHAYDSRDINGY